MAEFAEEVFVDVAEDVLGLERAVVEGHVGMSVDQAGQRLVDPPAGVALSSTPLSLGFSFSTASSASSSRRPMP
jgi:hypothetical protein